MNIADFHHFDCPTDNKNYLEEIIWDGDISSLINRLTKYDILNIVCCLEGDGVELRETLAATFNLNANDMQHLNARRDKYHMAECLRAANLPHVRQVIISSTQEAINKLPDVGGYPVVVKPRNSGNSNGFHICYNLPQLKSACEELLGKKNLLSHINETVLLQEFLSGTEYALNTISLNGKHYFTDAWSYENNFDSGYRICESCTLQPLIDKNITDYVSNCLNALGMKFGASHTELVLTSKGPVMIESAARVMGGLPNQLMRSALITTQLDALLTLLLNPGELAHTPFSAKAAAGIVNIIFRHQTGTITSIPSWENVTDLLSYRSHAIFVKEGDKVVQTKEGAACMARIFLVNEDVQQLQVDSNKLKAMEEKLFIIDWSDNNK